MSDYGRFDDGINEWREEMANSDDWQEQRKANYTPPKMRHEKALEFVERESYQGGAFAKLMAQAEYRYENDEEFDPEHEARLIKRMMVRNGECNKTEAKKMFSGANASWATIRREIILRNPKLAQCIRIRRCPISEFYKGTLIEELDLEKSAAINVEDGGDFAA